MAVQGVATGVSAGAGILTKVGAVLGPIGAIVGIAAAFLPFLKKNLNPQRDHDRNLADQVTEVGFAVWQAVSGEDRRSIKAGTSTLVGPDRGSNYPNVPKGPGGNLNVNIDDALAQVNSSINTAVSQLALETSKSNPAFANGAGGALALLNAVKQYRAAHPVEALVSSSNVKAGGGLLLGAVALGLLKWKGVF